MAISGKARKHSRAGLGQVARLVRKYRKKEAFNPHTDLSNREQREPQEL